MGLALPSFCWAAAAPADERLSADLVRGVGADERVLAFYRNRDWLGAWDADQERSLIAALEEAPRHGLETERFLGLLSSASGWLDREVGLTRVALGYADALAHGLADPKKLMSIFTLDQNRVEVASGLSEALARRQLGSWLRSLPPQERAYALLSDAYLLKRGEIATARSVEVPDGSVLRLGDTDLRVPLIVEALQGKGWPAPRDAGEPTTYGLGLEVTVRLFQDQEGLKVDGVIGPDTLEALNLGPADRARQIALNLERWRWLSRNTPSERIDVNTAAATFVYHRNGRLVHRARAVVGRADQQTPSLGASFDRLVLNPPWYVPSSIARREILPKGAAYLARNNMYVRNGRVVQRAGPRAALGQVKFDMQNRYAIYLHDTPAKALFDGNERHRSHGCVRIEKAVEFARRLAQERGRADAFEAALSSGRTRALDLGGAIAVRLLYRTAFVVDGTVRFAPDAYGRDEDLAVALGMPAKRQAGRRYATIPFGP